MLFTQHTFLFFFLVVFLVNLITRRWTKLNHIFLILANFIFFAYWSIPDFILMVSVVYLTYLMIRWMNSVKTISSQKTLLILTVWLDLGALILFKYRGFLYENFSYLPFMPAYPRPSFFNAILPLGISFYTFQCLSYAIDVYQKKIKLTSLSHFVLYITFFPQIIAGPIVRGSQLIPQIDQPSKNRPIQLETGLYWFALGFFFKAVCADYISDIIDPYWISGQHEALSAFAHWIIAFLYSCQIFSDFGGYSFMAIGLGFLLGFQLPENFNAPYLAKSFGEFWKRWHITLSSFLKDYLYIGALGGNRHGARRTIINIIIVMLLGGLWHGPAWTFICWGGLHGLALIIERLVGLHDRRQWHHWLITLCWFFVVQAVILLTWVFFRAPSLSYALSFVKCMFIFKPFENSLIPPDLMVGLIFTIPVLIHHIARLPQFNGTRLFNPLLKGSLAGFMFFIILIFMHRPQGFIYFTF